VSYGGSSTIAVCLAAGLLLAITRRNPFLSREALGLRQLLAETKVNPSTAPEHDNPRRSNSGAAKGNRI